jgi:FkbM family methyltransferase
MSLSMLKALPVKVLRKLGISKYFNYTIKTVMGETGITVPLNEGTLEPLLYMEETFKTSLLKSLESIARTDCFVDVGANLGQTLCEVFAQKPQVKYFGFEPNPEAFRLLRLIADINNIQVTLYPWACTLEAKPFELYATSKVDSGATLLPQIRPNIYEKTIKTWISGYPLDSILPHSLPENFILKIDVEGSENEVLRGAIDILSSKRPVILCEVLHAHTQTEVDYNNSRKSELENLLAANNYFIYMCTMNTSNREKLETIELISKFPKNIIWKDSPHTCDFVFMPNELPQPFG